MTNLSTFDEQFWNEYWRNYSVPASVDLNFSFERSLDRQLQKYLPEDAATVFEVGCAPGRWLIRLQQSKRYSVFGLESSRIGLQKTEDNFRLNGMSGTIFNGDFFDFQSELKFDVVLSLGFVEHFESPDSVIEKHIEFLKPNGTLVLGYPNFRGLNHLVQSYLDKSILQGHNLEIMNLEYIRSMAERYHLKLVYGGYLGGIEPSLWVYRGKNLIVKGMLRSLGILRRPRIWDFINHKLFSSYILGVFQR